jgi:DNA-binding response OmpR family regulator
MIRHFSQPNSNDNGLPVRRALIVEDEALIGMSMKECLERAGIQTVWVQTDKAAHIALNGQGDGFDALILDIDLGAGTTGFDIARYARKRFPEIGIVFSSGSPPDWLGAFGVEGALFLPKPSTEKGLLAALGAVAKAPMHPVIAQ